MKKFIVFSFRVYYPLGGLEDIVGSFDSLEEAKAFTKEREEYCNDIVDRDTWKLIHRVYGGGIEHETT